MPKKILIFIGVLVVACVVAVFVFIKGTPIARDANPLQNIEKADLARIEVRVENSTRAFVQKDKGWWLDEPIKDFTDPESFTQFVSYITNFTVDSIISENPERYNKFGVDEKRGKRLLVFKKGKSKPILDGYFGMTAGSFDSSYFRFVDGKNVHIANGFPIYFLSRSGNDFRLKKVIPINAKQAENIKISQEKETFEIQWSSPTWINGKTEKEFSEEKAQALRIELDDWKIWSFSEEAVNDETAGLDVPWMIISLNGPSGQVEVLIGKSVPKNGLNLPDRRYARTNGRQALLVVRDDAIQKILSHTKE